MSLPFPMSIIYIFISSLNLFINMTIFKAFSSEKLFSVSTNHKEIMK